MSGLIFRDYDQAALDRQYNNRLRYPTAAQALENYTGWSAETRRNLAARLDVPYGSQACETLDIFPADKPRAPIYVFIHGGYWQRLDKTDFSYVADGMVPNGVTTVVPNYGLAPTYRMDEIVRQNRAAIAWVWRHARELGGDPARIFVAGHSAGGHLTMMVLATDWPNFEPDLPSGIVTGGCAISGLYDMEPIRLCYLNETLGLDSPMARRNDPVCQRYPSKVPLTLAVGDLESPEYHRQALTMAAAWSRHGHPLELRLEAGCDHFNIVYPLRDPKSELVEAQLRHYPVTPASR